MSELTSNQIKLLNPKNFQYPIDFESNVDAVLTGTDSFYKFVKKKSGTDDSTATATVSFQDMNHAVSWFNAMSLSVFLDNAERLLYSRLGRQSQSLHKETSVVIGQISPELLEGHLANYKPFEIFTDYESVFIHGERHSIPIKCYRYKLTDYENGVGLPALITLNWQAMEDVIENNDNIIDTTIIRYIDITFRSNSKTGIVTVDYLMLSQPSK